MILVFQFFFHCFPLQRSRIIANQFDVWTSTVFYVQIQRGLTEIIQNLSMPLSLSLSIMNEWFHPCVLFVFASCQRDVSALKLTTFYAGSIHQRLSDSTDRAEDTFDRALQEICQGRKSSCWILDSLQLCMSLLDACWDLCSFWSWVEVAEGIQCFMVSWRSWVAK